MIRIVLASESPTRRALLANAGIAFEAISPGVDERAVEAPMIATGARPEAIAVELAEAKALAVGRLAPGALVVGADQVLDLDGERFVKPGTMAEARAQLMRLAGRSHRLHTAVAGVKGGTVRWRHTETAALTMRPLAKHEAEAYLLEVGEAALGSVGAYQIEGPGIRLFERIEGDYFGILGLPLLAVIGWLREEGAVM